MKVYDTIHKEELELDRQGLYLRYDAQQPPGWTSIRVEKKTDEDGYVYWDVRQWSTSANGRRFIRCYSLEGRVLRDSTSHNKYDLDNSFFPDEVE